MFPMRIESVRQIVRSHEVDRRVEIINGAVNKICPDIRAAVPETKDIELDLSHKLFTQVVNKSKNYSDIEIRSMISRTLEESESRWEETAKDTNLSPNHRLYAARMLAQIRIRMVRIEQNRR